MKFFIAIGQIEVKPLVSGKTMISWRNKAVRVQAKLVPRFVWTTASIDVFWGEQHIMSTGGQFKIRGSHSATFADEGSNHQAVLSWGQASRHRFPYQLQIDGIIIDNAQVDVENWRMGYIPFFLIIALLVLVFILW